MTRQSYYRRQLRLAAWTLLIVSSVLYVAAMAARGQEMHQHSHDGAAGRFYADWMMPDQPSTSCCNQQDCYPTEAQYRNGQWFAMQRETGQWVAVPPGKVETNRDNPDGRNHVCMSSAGTVYCFIAGGGT